MYGEKYNSSVVVKRAFYELQKGTDPDTNEQCLIARVPEREGTGKYYALLQQELHLTSFTDDSRIVRAKYYTTYPGAIALVMECFDGVPVERAVGLFHKDHAAVIRMGISISKILSGLHRNAIVHRSIDCRSILACRGPGQSEYTFALTFLGVGAYREGDIGMYCGLNIADYMETMMPAYISPELTGMVDIVP
ncbi:MAG TPA: serine/threonine-protein kinase, partial [Spirochaetota bacterium]|nr:serine/threonine-protein kinase [Spirochaetota bacterium]